MFQHSIWRLIFDLFEIPKLALKHFLIINYLFETEHSKPIRQPQADLAYRVYLKHQKNDFKKSESSNMFISEFGLDILLMLA